ncbi:MAG: hypothetical protein AB7U83_14990 [Vicinamibacterales bacterium]
MDGTRVTLARILELGVPLTWQDATALLIEAVRQGPANGAAVVVAVTPDSCVVTRGGEVALADGAASAGPDAVLELAGPLIAACGDSGDLGQAAAAGSLVPFLEAYADETPWRRRRVQIAAVALRGIAADADADRARADDEAEIASAAIAADGVAEQTAPAAAHDREAVRRFTRQTPRHDAAAARRERPPYRLKVVVTSRRRSSSVVGARLALWAAIVLSATAAGLGAWRVAAQAQAGRRPPVAGPDRVASEPVVPAPALRRTSHDLSPGPP